MRLLGQVRGYASTFGALSSPIGLDDEEPFRAIVQPGAFRLLGVITADVVHNASARIATSWNRGLRLWQDRYGLAIEIDAEASPAGIGAISMVSGGLNAMSIGLIIKAATAFYDEAGALCYDVTRADVDHVTICERGAFPGAVCWVASTPADRMSPAIAAASRRWHLGRIDHAQKQAADRALVARFLATPGARENFFAKAG